MQLRRNRRASLADDFPNASGKKIAPATNTEYIVELRGQKQEDQVAQEILSYLASHPQAQDTLEGIVEWWLLQQRIEYQTRIVRRALADLVKQGFVLETHVKDARTHYRLNPAKQVEITSLLQ